MAKYNVHGGHNSIVPGAVSILNEVTEDRKVKNKLISLLKSAGHTVYDCTDDSGRTSGANLANIVAKCNKHSVDLDISIHLNAGRSDTKGDGSTGGVEVFCYDSKTKDVAQNICNAIASAFGYHNRGVKYSTGLYVLRKTKSKAILIECCFVDDKDDTKVWNADKCAEAIYKGLTGKTASSSGSSSQTTTPKPPAASTSSSNKLDVDGKWGIKTTKRLQQIFGTTADGLVSNQFLCYKNENPGLMDASWEWYTNPSGYSPLIKAIQKKVGATADGHIGPKTIKKMQNWLGTTADGVVSNPSPMVKALQRWCNNQ